MQSPTSLADLASVPLAMPPNEAVLAKVSNPRVKPPSPNSSVALTQTMLHGVLGNSGLDNETIGALKSITAGLLKRKREDPAGMERELCVTKQTLESVCGEHIKKCKTVEKLQTDNRVCQETIAKLRKKNAQLEAKLQKRKTSGRPVGRRQQQKKLTCVPGMPTVEVFMENDEDGGSAGLVPTDDGSLVFTPAGLMRVVKFWFNLPCLNPVRSCTSGAAAYYHNTASVLLKAKCLSRRSVMNLTKSAIQGMPEFDGYVVVGPLDAFRRFLSVASDEQLRHIATHASFQCRDIDV